MSSHRSHPKRQCSAYAIDGFGSPGLSIWGHGFAARLPISQLPLAIVFTTLLHWSVNTFIMPYQLMLTDVHMQHESSRFSTAFNSLTNPSPKSCKRILLNRITQCTRPSNSSPCLFSSPPHLHQFYQPPTSVFLFFLLLKYGWSLYRDLDDFENFVRIGIRDSE